MTHETLTDDELTMLAKCQVAKDFDNARRSDRKIEMLAYPRIGHVKRMIIINKLAGLGLIEHTNGWRTTVAGTKILKDV